MSHIDLRNTKVEDQYKGAGNAFLVMENGEPSKLIYENPEFTAISKDLTENELVMLFIDHDADFDILERKKATVLIGTCSCYNFCFPEVFIDFMEEI